MNYFDGLVLAFAAMALVAVYQMRPCTLILAGNNMLVSRALSAIARGGPPASQLFQPSYVFSEENLSIAAGILAVSLFTLVGFTILAVRRRVRIGPAAPAVPRALLFAIGLYLILYAGAKSTIFTGSYGVDDRTYYDIELAGGHTLLCSILLYELTRRRLLAAITARKAFLIMFVIFALTGYAKGGTGLTTGYLITSAVLLLPRTGSARRLSNVTRIAAVMAAILVLSFVVRGVRASLAVEGTGAVSTFLEGIRRMEGERDDLGEGAESMANASQSGTHMLLCITLYGAGIDREWRSIYNVVEYTFLPSFFVRWFGWKRSIEPAWELAEYYIHGGGINVLGELYWNGGFLCVVIVGTALSLFCSIVDMRYRASPFWLFMVAQFAPAFLMGYGYGFPQVARGAINGLIAAGAYKFLLSLRGATTSPVPTGNSLGG